LKDSPVRGRLNEIYRGKRVLVTGHTGFKGSWLCQWLLMLGADITGFAIDCLDPSAFRQMQLDQRLVDVRGDVRDLSAVKDVVQQAQPDFIFHLAAQPLVRESYNDPVGTFATNVLGSVNVMEALRETDRPCAVVMVTTDKCYENREWLYAYRESDPLGGYDAYSASKAAAEIAIAAYRQSFFNPTRGSNIAIASARAGNVIGGGDWAADRIVPDCVRSLQRGEPIRVRNPSATRPWQHVLEPLSGYLALGAELFGATEETRRAALCSAFNFGPQLSSNRSVRSLVDEILKHQSGSVIDASDTHAPHEANLLNLAIDKAFHILNWKPVWDFERTIAETMSWYRDVGADAAEFTCEQIDRYVRDAANAGVAWAQ